MPATGTLAVADGAHGETVTATTSISGDLPNNSSEAYVLARVFVESTLVWGGYFPITDNAAQVGPLDATTWTSGPGDGTAELGYFTRSGMGKWIILATDTFSVSG